MPNHRELIQSSEKKRRFEFTRLPNWLQDLIMDGMDTGELTLEKAKVLIEESGYRLSHEAVAGYYREVRKMRRFQQSNEILADMMGRFGNEPSLKNLYAAVDFTLSMAVSAMSERDDFLGAAQSPLDAARLVPKLMAATAKMKQAEKQAELPTSGEETTAESLATEIAKQVREMEQRTVGEGE